MSACMSHGTKYSVYSKTKNGDWNKITFDVTEIALGGKISTLIRSKLVQKI